MSKQKNIVVFCTGFFSYDKIIKSSLEKNGYKVKLYDERAFQGVVGKALLRLNWRCLTRFKINKYFKKIYDELNQDNSTLLIINPECITPEIISLFKNKCERVIVYMWDSFSNKHGAVKLVNEVDHFYTFDPDDAEKYGLIFKPLFFSDSYYNVELTENFKYEMSFVGTLHSDRYRIVKSLTKNFGYFYFFYCPSIFVFLYKKYFLKEIKDIVFEDVSFSSMSENEVVNVMRISKSIIDISHPQQRGLTMRTIEALGAKRKIMTTNKEVKNYDFYNESNFLIIDSATTHDSVISFLDKTYIPTKHEVYMSYHVDNWVKDFILD